MKRLKIIEINIYLTLIIFIVGYLILNLIGFLMTIVNSLNPVISILGFCYLIYKILRKEIFNG